MKQPKGILCSLARGEPVAAWSVGQAAGRVREGAGVNAGTVTFLRRGGPVTILLVESEVLVRSAVADALRGEGYKVVEASSGQDALTVLKALPVHLVLVDLQLPGPTDGAAVADFAGSLTPAPKILLTGLAAADRAGLGPFVSKPYRVDQVIERVAESLGTSRGGS